MDLEVLLNRIHREFDSQKSVNSKLEFCQGYVSGLEENECISPEIANEAYKEIAMLANNISKILKIRNHGITRLKQRFDLGEADYNVISESLRTNRFSNEFLSHSFIGATSNSRDVHLITYRQRDIYVIYDLEARLPVTFLYESQFINKFTVLLTKLQ